MSVLIKLRRGLASEWISQNVILASGEPGYELDTGRLKIGNGSTAWNSLQYASVIPTGLLAGSGISINLGTNGSNATISVSGLNSSYISDFNEAIDDRIGSGLFNAGTGINLNYNDSGNTFTVSVTGLINNPTNNRILTSRDSTTTGIDAESNATFDGNLLNIIGSGNFTSGLFVNGTGVSLFGHKHVVDDIVNFASGVADEISTSLIAGSGINLSYDNISDTLTIGVTGVSFSGHTHNSSQITDFNTSVSGLLPGVTGTGYVVSSLNNNIYTISVTGLQPTGNYSLVGHTHTSSNITDFNSSVSGLLPVKNISSGSGINVSSTTGNFTISVSGLNSTYISDFNEAIDDRIGSGLFVAGTGISLVYNDSGNSFTVSATGLIANPSNNRILTSRDSTSTGIDAESNLIFDGSLLTVSGNLVANTGTINSLNFNNIGDPDLSIRQLVWNNSEGSLALALSNTYDMYLGGELHYRVRNETGAPIIAGTAVYASGVTGGSKRITVAPKAADGSIRETRFMGLVTENIDNGVNGFTTHFGYIRNIDTRGDYAANGATNKVWASGEPVWAEGDLLYVHPTVAGKLTKIEPKHSISVAIILNRHQSEGKLFVRPTSYGHLGDNHDVAVSGATNGQFLQYNSATDYWVPSSSGNFTTLQVNGTGVSVSGHNHTSSEITDFNSSVSGLLPTIANSGDNRILTSTGSSVGINAEINLTFDSQTLRLQTSEDSYTDIIFSQDSSDRLIIRYDDDNNESTIVANTYPLFIRGPSSIGTGYISFEQDSRITLYSNSGVYITDSNFAIDNQTANTIASFNANKNVVSLSTGTYPNLTELSYVKGVTSAIQTQINNKANTSVSITAGSGLAGGGDLSTNRTLDVGQGDGITVSADSIAVNSTVVRTTGSQTISGTHTFSGATVFGSNVTVSGNLVMNNQTASTIAGFDASKNVSSLSTTTYPSLTELSYVKGATSAIQTQLNGKQNTLTNPVTGTGVASHIAYWNSSSGIVADSGQLYWDASNNRLGLGTASPSYALDVVGTGNFSQNLLVNGTVVSVSGHTHIVNDITDFSTGVADEVSTTLSAGTGINLNYDSGTDTLTVSVSGLINNPTNNRILTSRDSTTTGIDAESNATFDGTTLAVSGAVTVDNLKLDGNTISSTNSNGNIIIQPSGTGALQRDGGGNARGQYAVDWQTVRSSGTMVAAGNYSVIGGGANNTASGFYSTVGGGRNNTASANYSAVGGGRFNTASDFGSAVGGGWLNTASGFYSTVGGGRNNTASANYSAVGGGRYNTASGYVSTVAGGRNNTSLGRFATVSGGYKNTSAVGSVSAGLNNVASGGASVVSGGGIAGTVTVTIASPAVFTMNGHGLAVNDIIRLQTTGALPTGLVADMNYFVISTGLTDNAFSVSTSQGGSAVNTSGSQSGTHTLWSITASNLASGNGSVVGGGLKNTGSGNHSSVVGGSRNTASGYQSFVGGGTINIASASQSTVGGGRNNTASAIYSTIPGGFQAKTSGYGENSHASGRFANNGDAQHTILIARKLTTNNTANQVLFLDNSSARLTLPAKTTWTFEIKLSAYNDTDNAAAGWIYRGVIRRNDANSTVLVGSLIEESWKESAMNSASASVVADDTNEALEIRVTGLTSKNIRWVAVVDISQVSYGTP
jgi:hypothetical protein